VWCRRAAVLWARRAVILGFAVVVLAVCVAGCSASSSVTGSRIDVTMHDFGIRVSRTSVPAGPVVLHVKNDGPSTHEINVDLTRYAAGRIRLKRPSRATEPGQRF
jgi:hypothetical protein